MQCMFTLSRMRRRAPPAGRSPNGGKKGHVAISMRSRLLVSVLEGSYSDVRVSDDSVCA